MSSIKNQLGSRIKEIRKGKRLSQDKLSEKVGIDSKHLSRIEVGGSFPSIKTLEKLAKYLNVEVKDFFEFSPETDNPKELKVIINGLINDATAEELKIAVKVLKGIVR